MCSKIGFSTVVFFLLSIGILSAQDTQQPLARPKIGLVLGGGGARGLAHLGVLEWFEKNHIPVDSIGGTSMGGLIGGLYATGMTTAEIRQLIEQVDWVDAFSAGVRYEDLSFRRKEDRREFPIDLELGLKNGISLPAGLSTGLKVGHIIDQATIAYSTTANFDDLPIPYFCVATDVVNAKEVVLTAGSLASAMRATMSLPAIFPPVKRDGKWLVDGGVLNNLPVDVMKTRGVDVVIAVNVGTPLGTEKDIASLFGVVGQTVGVFMEGNIQKNLREADIVISPELGTITTTQFKDTSKIADLGVPAAQAKSDVLLKYALDDQAWQQYLEKRESQKKSIAGAIPTEVRISGVSDNAAKQIHEEFSNFAGKPLNLPLVEKACTRLCGEGRYQTADYWLGTNDAGAQTLEIGITEKPYAPPTLNFGLRMQGSDISDFEVGFAGRLTVFDILGYGSEWRSDLVVGAGSRFSTEIYRPFGSKRLIKQKNFFSSLYGVYERGPRDLFTEGQRVANYSVNNYGAGLDFGIVTWRTELRFGGVIEHIDAEPSTAQTDVTPIAGRSDYVRLRWFFDGANSATIPTKGFRFGSELRYYFDAPEKIEEFPWWETGTSVFKPIGRRGTLFAAGSFGTTFDKEAAPLQKFTLGGPFQLGAYDPGEFAGNHKILISTGYYHRVYQLPALVGGGVWLISWLDYGGAFDDFNDADYVTQGSVGIVMDTRLGPFGIIGAFGEWGKGNVYFSFGKFF